jgi:phage gpG-like protein
LVSFLRPPGGRGSIPLGEYGVPGGTIELYGDWGGGLATAEDFEDPNAAADAMLRLATYLEDTRVELEATKEILIRDTKNRFDTETDPDGTPWVPLNKEYLDSKLAKGYPADILVREDTLRSAATSDEAWIVEDDTLYFDPTTLPYYAGYQQRGTEKGIPARPFVGVSEEGLIEITDLFDSWVDFGVDEVFVNPRTGTVQSWQMRGNVRLFGSKIGQF